MNRLVRVELTRLWWRRLPLVAVLALLVVLALSLYGVSQGAREVSASLAGQNQEFNRAVADWEANGAEMLAQCEQEEQRESEVTGQEVDFGCATMEPTVESWFGTPPSVFEQVSQLLLGVSWVLLFAAGVIGCSATAKELTQRTLGTWLTFEPRRTPVYLSKLAAAALWSVPLTLVVVAGVFLGGVGVLTYYGVPDGLTPAQWSDLGWSAVRLLTLTAVVAAAGAAAGFVVRNVAILIGLGVGYAIAVEGVLTGLVPSVRSWTLSRNMMAWLQDGTEWFAFGLCDETGCEQTRHSLTLVQGAAYLGVVAVLLILVGYLVFRRRDLE